MNDNFSPRARILTVLTAVVLFIPSIAWKGFVFAQLWNWFVAPTFGVVVLTLAQSAGIVIMIQFIKFTPTEKPVINLPEYLAHTFSIPLLMLGTGWVVHWIFFF